MRILYLVDSFRPSRSACANRASVLVKALLDDGHDVQVLASSDSLLQAPSDYCKPNFVSFFNTFPLEKKSLVNRLKNNFGSYFSSIKAASQMGDFDVVICTTPPLLLTQSAVKIAKEKNARLVLDVRDIWPDVAYEMGTFTPSSPYGHFFESLANRAYRHSDVIVSVSPGKVEKLKKRVSNCRVALVPNGIDEEFVRNSESKEIVQQYRLDKGPICSYVGNIGLAQGLSTLLDLAEHRRDVRFLVFGKGAEESSLRDLAVSRNLKNIEFCGIVDASGVFTVLRHSIFTFIPLVSSRLTDSVPTKMYEAIACGCPVLLAAVGDAATLLDESGLGLHAPPEDFEGILAAFNKLILEPYSKVDCHKASTWMIAKHSRQKYANDFIEEINRLKAKQ